MKKNGKGTFGFLLTLALVVSILTGCMGNQAVVDIHADGTCSFQIKYYYEKSMLDLILMDSTESSEFVFTASGDFEQGTEVRYGKTYYSFSRTFSFASIEEMTGFLTNIDTYIETMKRDSKNPSLYTREEFDSPLFQSLTADTTQFVGTLAFDADSDTPAKKSSNKTVSLKRADQNDEEYLKTMGVIIDVAVTLPSAIVESNGTVNGTTASWTIENLPIDYKLMAFTTAGAMSSDTTAPVIRGAKDGGLYNKVVNLWAEDNMTLKSFEVNGKERSEAGFQAVKTGKYQVAATDFAGNRTEMTFRIDMKYPTIQGLKGGRIQKHGITLRFRDNVGIRSVKLNGKKVNKKKITLKKPGTYVIKVTDKAGNVTKRLFRIRKYTA